MRIRVLRGEEVRRGLPMNVCIDAMRGAFAQLAAHQVEVPLRTRLTTPDGVTLFMPAYLKQNPALGQKIVSIYEGNAQKGLPTISALVIMLDPVTGLPAALIDGTSLTALRTGAASGLATDLLARPESAVLTVFGAGAQAPDQVEAVLAVRPIREVRILSRTGVSAQRLAERVAAAHPEITVRAVQDPVAAVRDADVICTATPARQPLFPADAVRPGTHINAIGSFTPEMCELPPELLADALVVVDQREAAWAEAGELIQAQQAGLLGPDEVVELGDIVLGRHKGRANPVQITVFKSVGLAIQDVAAAVRLLARAEREGLGTLVEL